MTKLLVIAISAALMLPATASAAQYNTVPCRTASHFVLKFKPRNCVLGGEYGYQQANLRGIRWRSWQGPTAFGRATLRANMGFRAKVRFKLYRRDRWEENTYLFTRATGTTFMPDGSERHWTLKLV
jgi:hypothetical protein